MAVIYQTTQMGEAHVLVALVSHRGEADLLVRRASSLAMATGEALWFLTRDKHAANTCVCFTSAGYAHVKICFVDNDSEAGWQRPSRYKGRFR